jgi:IQ and ubiquitin-like domain-containing protein
MPVAVQKAPRNSKAYIGGYRNKKTGLLYHHASTNTASKIERKDIWKNPENKTHRDTQTYVMKTRSIMTGREFGTQMKRNDLLIDDSSDVEIIAKPYFTSAELGELKKRTVLIIQCYWRGYVARKRCWEMREAHYNAYVEFREKQELVGCSLFFHLCFFFFFFSM